MIIYIILSVIAEFFRAIDKYFELTPNHNPAARLDEINKAAEAVETARQAFNDAANRLNALQVAGFKHVARISGL